MDQIIQTVEPVRQFAKDSIRLVKRCTKPDKKGNFCLFDFFFLTWRSNKRLSFLSHFHSFKYVLSKMKYSFVKRCTKPDKKGMIYDHVFRQIQMKMSAWS